jgi:hypothetical protein
VSVDPILAPTPPRPRFWIAELLQRALSTSAVFAPEEKPTAPLGAETPSPANHPEQPCTEPTSQHTEACSNKEETANP